MRTMALVFGECYMISYNVTALYKGCKWCNLDDVILNVKLTIYDEQFWRSFLFIVELQIRHTIYMQKEIVLYPQRPRFHDFFWR